MKIDMRLEKLLAIGFVFLIFAAVASAQNTLPSPNDDACWSSLDALRSCQLRAYSVAQDYDQRCTSYPEYQCLPAEPWQSSENAAATQDENKAETATDKGKPGLKPLLIPSDVEGRTGKAK
jgi:hypothetical protein